MVFAIAGQFTHWLAAPHKQKARKKQVYGTSVLTARAVCLK